MTKADLQDLQSPLTFIPIIPGRGKAAALLEVHEDWIETTVWVTARNQAIVVETGRTVEADSANVHTITALRERIATGDGPKAGDILVVDEFSLLDHHSDDRLIQQLADSGVIVKVLADLRSGYLCQ